MPRVKRSVAARKKRRKVLGQAKGYWGLKKSSYRYAKEQVDHSLTYAYRDRKNKKRTFRRLWIMRINAGARANGLSYNQFIAGLKKADIEETAPMSISFMPSGIDKLLSPEELRDVITFLMTDEPRPAPARKPAAPAARP